MAMLDMPVAAAADITLLSLLWDRLCCPIPALQVSGIQFWQEQPVIAVLRCSLVIANEHLKVHALQQGKNAVTAPFPCCTTILCCKHVGIVTSRCIIFEPDEAPWALDVASCNQPHFASVYSGAVATQFNMALLKFCTYCRELYKPAVVLQCTTFLTAVMYHEMFLGLLM